MHIIRRIVVVLLVGVLPLLLFATALDFGIVQTIGRPAKVKNILADSGIYQNLIPATLEQANQESGNSNTVSLVDPTVKQAATQTLTPRFLQSSTENIIDGIYHWLEGKVPQPDFKIDLSSKKTVFANLVADHARQIASKLPACSLSAPPPNPSSYDVFSAKCLPPGITPSAVAANVKSELLKNKNFLKDPVITASNLKSANSNQSVFDTSFKDAPTYYQWAKRTPFIFSLLSLLAIAGVIFLSSTRRKGLRRAGIVLAVMGVLLLVFAWGLNYGVTKQALPRLKINNKVLQNDIKALATDLTQDVDQGYWIAGGVYAALGVAAIAGYIYLNKKSAKAEAETTPGEPKTPNESEALRKPAKPKKQPPKIQG